VDVEEGGTAFATVFGPMRILFVDDLPDTRDVFRLAFGIQGHTTRLASNGREAVEAVREEAFDAVIIDVEMPEMNGFDAVLHMRGLPNGNAVPIIMFTAYGDSETQEKASKLEPTCCFTTDLPQELLMRIQQLSS
jgi:CheY-like chemotaxis protein